MDWDKLAAELFPNVEQEPGDYLKRYPPRQLQEGVRVTRFAPSPTGFLHIGGLYAAMAARLTAKATGGIFYLRIEDTDKKREVAGGIDLILDGLRTFGIEPDEGVMGQDQESGAYGPYTQSRRREIYQAFAKDLIRQGLAYPCFAAPEELDTLREQQEAAGVNKGYYGRWAVWRHRNMEDIEAQLQAGTPYVIRLRAPGREDGKCYLNDLIRGKIELPENTQDIVLLKTDGIPTYHFAHAVDDALMGTTHIVRGDEWIASVPIHLQLFQVLGFKPPKYAHIAPIMKEDNGGRRKLSKRRDPEAAVSYYTEAGYPASSVMEYLMTLASSSFEDWRRANKTAPRSEFPFNLKKMSVSGALFDLVKLEDVSKNVISAMDADTVLDMSTRWARQYYPALYEQYRSDPDYMKAILSIDRGTPKPRKDIAKWGDIPDYISYFYQETYQEDFTLPQHIPLDLAADVLHQYRSAYCPQDDKEQWFARIKGMCEGLGCTPNVKEYKQHPEAYRGHVGDVSTIIRVAVTGRQNTPDLHAILSLLGEETVRMRLDRALEHYKKHA
ncbi:MAG: glutamate--tRNA ligase [Clostridiales bacterium]|nr:glutamate--tRNA ligase [Clostridiales bacterium]